MRLFVNLFCRDIEAQLAFYRSLLGLPEATHARSPIYRALETPQFQFGFHAPAAYGLLQLADRAPPPDAPPPATAYATFMLASDEAVDAATARVRDLGGQVVKGPYATYYGQWQAVLCDPEGHVFRLSADGLPAGASAPPVPPGP